MTKGNLISEAEAARRLGVDPRTLAKWALVGRVVPFSITATNRRIYSASTLKVGPKPTKEPLA